MISAAREDTAIMATTPSPFTLDPYGQTMVKLWHAASARLTAGPESNDVLVHAAGQAVVAWLRLDALTPPGHEALQRLIDGGVTLGKTEADDRRHRIVFIESRNRDGGHLVFSHEALAESLVGFVEA